MTTLRERREQRANVWSEMQEIRDAVDADGGGWTAELRQQWDRADARLTELTDDIERDERDDELSSRFDDIDAETRDRNGGRRSDGTGNDGGDEYRAAFEQWVRFGFNDMETGQRQLLQQRAVDTRAQGVASGAAGGYTVPEGFWAKVTEAMKFYAVVASIAETVTTGSGNKMPWATEDDTNNEGELLDENTPVGGQDVTFGRAMLDAHTFSSKLVLVSLLLLQDSGVDIEARVARALGKRLGRVTNRFFTNGNGSAQPQGYTFAATMGTQADLSDSEFDPENAWLAFVNLIHSVDVAYRSSGRFALHDLVLAEVRKWRDLDGRPLWIPSVAAGVPDTILSYPYFVNNFQSPDLTAGARPAYFGNFEDGFVIRTVTGGMLKRLEERYAENLQIGFFGFSRHDSLVQDPSAIKYLELVA